MVLWHPREVTRGATGNLTGRRTEIEVGGEVTISLSSPEQSRDYCELNRRTGVGSVGQKKIKTT